ncbi:MAG: AAA family ATPase [Woeseiaceae bacterium]|nr:AAA family ATPase [Woeseiaceae bacterium]
MSYLRSREELTINGLADFVDKIESCIVLNEKIIENFRANIFNHISLIILSNNKILGNFDSSEHENLRRKFREIDKKLMKAQRELIAAKASNISLPSGENSPVVSNKTEIHCIKHELGKKTRFISTRNLLSRAGETISTIKPCFLMSPTSVAQYLDPNIEPFDLLIMDEASQIKVEYAIGSIARSKQLVIVGDPKQLPPTTFFEQTLYEEPDEDDELDIQDMESILDLMMSRVRLRRLRWHYRSKHHDLIKFSNHQFYDSDLLVFPSPHSSKSGYGLIYREIEGTFNNGINHDEITAVIGEIKNHSIMYPNETLGIAAMNRKQSDAIEDELLNLERGDSEFREWKRKISRKDPIFIKNLENIQGDERDVIIISMTYGKDKDGNLNSFFGPISKPGGHRRINVLITRSKKKMIVISSLKTENIKGDSDGNRAVRGFIEFCKTKKLPQNIKITNRPPDSDFEIDVARSLNRSGFKCEMQLGVDGFFLDIAVLHPDKEDQYIMCIECDGATYHSSVTARDRDRIRQEHLENLGWTVRRIWSTEWFNNSKRVIDPIINELNEIIKSEPKNQEIIENQQQSNELDQFKLILESDTPLEDKLTRFNDKIVKKEIPNTDDEERLLNKNIIKILVNELPQNREEFAEVTPEYMRKKICRKEAHEFMNMVLEIVRYES